MKKIFTFLTILVSIFTFSVFTVRADSTHFYNITTTLGEDTTEMRVNYHSDLDSSVVRFGTDKSLATYTEVTPESHIWGIEQREDDEETGFADRYVCSAEFENLSLDTTYYYQIVSGSEKSKIYSFVTASGRDTKFAWLTDTQSWGENYKLVDNLYQKMKAKHSDISFVLTSGDNVDRGGYESQWDLFYDGLAFLDSTPIATIPGNHEYYHSKDAGYIDPSIYNEFFNNPKNGPTERLNSTYYFKYNNILFIMLDVIKADYCAEQQAWFEKVVQENPAEFIIVSSHRGVMDTGANSSDSQWMYANWRPLFEKYNVDLALNGHDHVFGYTKPLVNGVVDELLGTTYAVGPSAALKGTAMGATQKQKFAHNETIKNAGCVVEVFGDTLTLTLYDEEGNTEPEWTFSIKSRRKQAASFNQSGFLRELKVTRDDATKETFLTWKSNAYGYVSTINVVNALEGTTYPELALSTSNISKMPIGISYTDRNYLYDVFITLKDGTSLYKRIEVENDSSIEIPNPLIAPQNVKAEKVEDGIKISFDEVKDAEYYELKVLSSFSSEIYLGTIKNGDILPYEVIERAGNYRFMVKAYDDDQEDTANDSSFSKEIVLQLLSKTITFQFDEENSVKVQFVENAKTKAYQDPTINPGYKAKWLLNGEEFTFGSKLEENITLECEWVTLENVKVNFDTQGGSSINPIEVQEYGYISAMPANPTKNGYTFKGWTLNGEAFDFATQITEEITLVATWEKAPQQSAGGCNMGSVYLTVTLLSAVSLCALALRRQK